MQHPSRFVLFRNVSVSLVNGLLTLIILLIAPLGLVAVITCTAAVTLASFVVGATSDQILRWLTERSPVQIINQR